MGKMYKKKQHVPSREHTNKQENEMDLKMDLRTIMKDVENFSNSHMTWKERKKIEDRKVVSLGGKFGRNLVNKETNSYYKDLPVFENLTKLCLSWRPHTQLHEWDEVVKMLHNCPKLQFLTIFKADSSPTKEDWKYPFHVPQCLSSHLTTINITEYEAIEADFRFASYILENARHLQNMIICRNLLPKPMESPRFLSDLFSCSRISPTWMGKMYKKKQHVPSREHTNKQENEMDLKMDLRTIMKDVENFSNSHMTWKERKKIEDRKVVSLGGKPLKNQRLSLSVARPMMKKQKQREEKMLQERMILGRFGGKVGGSSKSKKPVGKHKPEDRGLKLSEGRFRNGILDVKHLLKSTPTRGHDTGKNMSNIGKRKGGNGKHDKKGGGKKHEMF
ncbi:uncharacterized protein LOC131643176 isoform X2 [Vicia villosa]|uniref:uncharacterized protein LOC131643176 isoform X2 n=1 Tax=Vicia villosa TaxID=3911 RepID=UPI00273AA82A|nr:uncharacterized protein LOC131643176 isoform X2 [Vicia villosa]